MKDLKFCETKRNETNGILRNGTLRNGTLRNGILRNGILRNGTLRNGTLRNGTLRNGLPIPSLYFTLCFSDINRVTGVHNSYPRVITISQFGSNEYAF